jgi:hypothetical protein
MFDPEDNIALQEVGVGKGLSGLNKIRKAKVKGKFSELEAPKTNPKTERVKAKDKKGESKAVAQSKTRESLEDLEVRRKKEDIERKKKLGEKADSPKLDYSSFK